MTQLFAGVDVGGTHIRVAVGHPDQFAVGHADQFAVGHADQFAVGHPDQFAVDHRGPHEIVRTVVPTPPEYPAFLDRVAEAIHQTCEETGVPPSRLARVGIGLPGTVANGVATFLPALPGYDGAAVAADVQACTGAPVRLANDAQCALLAEHRLGAAAGHRHVALVVVGTGVGGAMLVDGTLYRGGQGAAGAFGWLPGGGASDDRHGAWEQLASGRSLTLRAQRLGMPPDELMVRAARGDRTSRDVVGEYAYTLGRGLAAIASTWDPEVLVVGGVITAHLGVLSAGIARAFDDWASPAGRRVPRVAATLGPDAGVLGALCLADDRRSA